MFALAKEIGAAPCLRYWFWQNWRIMLTCAFGDLASKLHGRVDRESRSKFKDFRSLTLKNMHGHNWMSKSTIRNHVFICVIHMVHQLCLYIYDIILYWDLLWGSKLLILSWKNLSFVAFQMVSFVVPRSSSCAHLPSSRTFSQCSLPGGIHRHLGAKVGGEISWGKWCVFWVTLTVQFVEMTWNDIIHPEGRKLLWRPLAAQSCTTSCGHDHWFGTQFPVPAPSTNRIQ